MRLKLRCEWYRQKPVEHFICYYARGITWTRVGNVPIGFQITNVKLAILNLRYICRVRKRLLTASFKPKAIIQNKDGDVIFLT